MVNLLRGTLGQYPVRLECVCVWFWPGAGTTVSHSSCREPIVAPLSSVISPQHPIKTALNTWNWLRPWQTSNSLEPNHWRLNPNHTRPQSTQVLYERINSTLYRCRRVRDSNFVKGKIQWVRIPRSKPRLPKCFWFWHNNSKRYKCHTVLIQT